MNSSYYENSTIPGSFYYFLNVSVCFFVFYSISTLVGYLMLNLVGIYIYVCVCVLLVSDTIYPTPPLGQDMTQGQFLSGV